MSSKIKIVGFRKAKKEEVFDVADFRANIQNYYVIKLDEFVTDSVVEVVYLHWEVIASITQLSEDSLNEKPVKEVGGFLLGTSIQEMESEKYDVIIERFLPDNSADFNSPSRLQFGEKVLEEVVNNKRERPDWRMMGWFHTHPGHTPFLSTFDIKIQERLFTDDDQIAIVLDTETAAFDTGVFTKQGTGRTNNKYDYALTKEKTPKWIDWKFIANWADAQKKDKIK